MSPSPSSFTSPNPMFEPMAHIWSEEDEETYQVWRIGVISRLKAKEGKEDEETWKVYQVRYPQGDGIFRWGFTSLEEVADECKTRFN
jgi:hypothetical protein